MGRLFGTDGVRGVANTELDCTLAMNIGKAAAMVLINGRIKRPTVLIGRDTRLSGTMLEGALVAGLCSVGANAVILGEIPTPAVAYLVRKYKADAGIMISASHNPFEFNGIKIFSEEGYKLPDDLEEEIEAIVLDASQDYFVPESSALGTVSFAHSAIKDYTDFVISTAPHRLNGLEIALDCSNGAAAKTAQMIFEALGAKCHMLSIEPNGININDNCGSTHMETLMKYVRKNNLNAGLAFDGDADRCLAVDENGELVDGDFIIAICAEDMKQRGVLKKNTVVGTVMTNMGFVRFCKENGMDFAATKVGDRYVLETMLQQDYNIGGEQSGHVIFTDFATTGDGQLTGVQLLSLMNRRGEPLSKLAKIMSRYPQILINVKASHEGKTRFYTDKEIKAEIKRVTDILGEDGRIVVRVSGTEPLIRVMLEGNNIELITKLANETANLVKERLS